MGTRMKNFFRHDGGAVAIIFAFCLPMIVAGAGVGMDLSQAYLVRQKLGNALDASALAGAAMGGDEAEIQERVQAFFDANYPPGKIGAAYGLTAALDGDVVTVSAEATFQTTFMSVFGIDSLTIHKEVAVTRQVTGLEVVLVLDNTGSMSTNNNIGALRTATTNFINILFDAVDDPDDIKIGMVPYSSSVRVGRYGLGLKPDGTAYGDGTVFVTLPSGISYTTSHSSSTGWYGCVVEHKETNYDASATHVSGSYGQLWRTAASCSTSTNCRGHGWDANSGSNDPYPDDIPDGYAGPWDIYMYGTVTRNCTGTCNPKYTFNKASQPNTNCPYANLIPLTSSQSELLANVDTMQAHGYTLSNTGLAWGYRVLSPETPFIEAAPWDDDEWRKAIIIMTDGETNMGGNYTSYWFTAKNDIVSSTLDDRMLEICDNLKNKDNPVLIYTITFATDIPEETKAAYRSCATSESFYYDAPSQDDLATAFETIARQLANLHLSH